MTQDIRAQFAEQGRQRRQRQPHRKGRFLRYLIAAVNLGFLVWWFRTLTTPGDDPVQAAVSGMLLLVFWAIVDVILGVVYLVARDRR